jgi:hypothetical protein
MERVSRESSTTNAVRTVTPGAVLTTAFQGGATLFGGRGLFIAQIRPLCLQRKAHLSGLLNLLASQQRRLRTPPTGLGPEDHIIPAGNAGLSEINETVAIDGEVMPKAEMIACEACLRANPPTRATCIYCAAGLRVTGKNPLAESTPSPPAAEADSAYQIVLAPAQARYISESALAAAASLLDLQVAELNAVLDARQPLPLARAATLAQATMLGGELRAMGIENIMVADGELNLGNPAKRVRSLEFSANSMTGIAMPGGAKVSARWSDLILVVTGRLLVNRVEVEERRHRGRNQLLDSRELSTDESVLDLHLRSDEAGWRILASNFDFSCLGSVKAVTAFANFMVLINLLRERATNSHFDDSYGRLRPALAAVWPVEPQTSKGELRCRGGGRFDVATVTTNDNEGQFTLYSRLCRQLRLRELENEG